MLHPSLHSRSDLYELEILDGLAPICSQELQALLGNKGEIIDTSAPDRITFCYSGNSADLISLRTPVAVFRLHYFKVPSPLKLLSEVHFERLMACIELNMSSAHFKSFRINAAGSDSQVFRKLKSRIEKGSGLKHIDQDGEMSIRFRRSKLKNFGWDVLIRMTPKPLSARAWRKENMPGALNATIAAAMILSLDPNPDDTFLNLMCGSGTLLVERALRCASAKLLGLDLSVAALAQARINLGKSANQCTLIHANASQLPIADSSISKICCDLPWGRLIGKNISLDKLYLNALREASRICAPNGLFGVITQESEIFERVLIQFKSSWRVRESLRVKQADYKPKIIILERRSHARDF